MKPLRAVTAIKSSEKLWPRALARAWRTYKRSPPDVKSKISQCKLLGESERNVAPSRL